MTAPERTRRLAHLRVLAIAAGVLVGLSVVAEVFHAWRTLTALAVVLLLVVIFCVDGLRAVAARDGEARR